MKFMQKWTSSLKFIVIVSVTLKLCEEYLYVLTHDTTVLLQMKNWTVWYMKRFHMSTYTGVTNFWKQSDFLADPVQYERLYYRQQCGCTVLNIANVGLHTNIQIRCSDVTKFCIHGHQVYTPRRYVVGQAMFGIWSKIDVSGTSVSRRNTD